MVSQSTVEDAGCFKTSVTKHHILEDLLPQYDSIILSSVEREPYLSVNHLVSVMFCL